ncbi:MAG: general stress protein [Coleofasciculaceae cyanobacterium]
MVLGQHKRAVGVFSTRREAELALRELKDSNFAMDRVSVIAQDADDVGNMAGADVRDDIRDSDDNKADEGAKAGAVTGGALGGLTGLLVGLGSLAIPGVGPIMLAGATATAIATTVAGGAIGAAAGSLLGALIGLGIPEDEARNYNERISRGHYLVMIEGSDAEIARAQSILSRGGVEDWAIYDIPNPGGTNPAYATGVATAAATAGTTRRTTGTGRKRRAIGVFSHRRDAEAAIRDLRDSGFDMNQMSLIGKDVQSGTAAGSNEIKTGNKADEGAKAGAATGGALGGLTGLLVGLGALAIPGVGPVIAGGALATALATTAAGGAIGAAAGGLTGALVGLGIPEDRARFYNDRFNRGDYLVMVDAMDDEIHTAHAILNRHGIQDWGVYDYSDDHDRSYDTTSNRVPTGVAAGTGSNSRYHRAVGVFPHRRDAETAMRELRDAGFNMNQISLVGKDDRGNTSSSGSLTDKTKTDEGAKAGAATGGALGGLTGLLVGLGALAIPGVGPVIAGGALATALATTAAGGAIGAAAGGLTGALVGLGIPDDRARFYSDRVNHGDYLVMVDGTESEILQAETILSRRGIQNWAIFDAPDQGNRMGSTTTTATRNVTSTTSTVDTSRADYQVVDNTPEVVIIDKRNQTI